MKPAALLVLTLGTVAAVPALPLLGLCLIIFPLQLSEAPDAGVMFAATIASAVLLTGGLIIGWGAWLAGRVRLALVCFVPVVLVGAVAAWLWWRALT